MGKLSGLVGHVNLIAANFRSFPAKPEEQELSSISSNVGSYFLQPEGNSDHIHQYDLSILVEQFCPFLLPECPIKTVCLCTMGKCNREIKAGSI